MLAENKTTAKIREPLKLFICLISALPFLYILLYFIKNNQLPANDAANYLSTTVSIYQHFQDQGILRGILHYYTERGWRPIFFPQLAAPFLIIAHGNLFFAYWATAILCLSATAIYVFAFFKLKLDKISAAIATSAICLLPYVQTQLILFYAEAALFPCIIGAIYHLIQSDYLRKKNHSCGFVILTALAAILRPIEAITHLFFILIAFLSTGYFKKIFTLSQLIQTAFISFLAVFLIFAAASLPYWHHPIVAAIDNGGALDKKMALTLHYCLIGSSLASIFFALVTAITYKMNKAVQDKKNYLLPTALSFFALLLIWFLPFSLQTFQWVYRTSLGDVATSTGSLSGSQFSWNVLRIYLQEEGLFAVIIIGITAILGLCSLNFSEIKKTLFSASIIYLVLLTPFSLWEAFYTVQIITRKLSLTFPALLMAMLIIGLQKNKGWNLRIKLLSFLTIAQFALLCVLLFTADYQNRNPLLNNSIGYFIPQPSIIHPNPHDVVINFFNQQAKLLQLDSFGLEVIPGTPDARHPIEAEPINPFLLSMMISAARTPYYANYLYFSTYSPENINKIKNQYSAIFLSDKLADMEISANAHNYYSKKYSDETNPSIKTFYGLLRHYSDNTLESIGWKLGPCIVINTQKQGDYRGCLLLNMRVD